MKKKVIDINIFMDFLFKREGHEKLRKYLAMHKRLCKRVFLRA
jgi:predicted nucleic acid-binding protein